MTDASSKRIPPYLPFKTFLSSFDALSHGVPPRLDRTLWKGQSGINQGLIMNSYRFFLLVNQRDESTELLSQMARQPAKRPELIKTMVNDQYLIMVDKAGDLSKCTMRMLEDAFEEVYSVKGDTKQKAITFFLKAAKFGDLPLSPYLLAQLRNDAKRKRRQRNGQEEGTKGSPSADDAKGLSSHTVQLVGGGHLTISISANPFTMPSEDRNFFFSVIDMLQKYGEEHADQQGKTLRGDEQE